MKFMHAILLIVCSAGTLHAGASLKDARHRLLKGNYAEAREMYQELARDAKSRVAANLGIGKTLQSEGEYDKALAHYDAILKDLPDNADFLAARAEILYQRGRWSDAEKSARAALAKNDDHFLARWVLGQVLRDTGKQDKAYEEFRWFVNAYNDKNIEDPDELLITSLAILERARWFHQTQLFQDVLDDIITKEIIANHKSFWPAEFEFGRLFLEKHNQQQAAKAFDRALAINPRAADVFAHKGLASMQRLDIKDADQFADQALEINPRLTHALRLKADVHLFGGDIDEALKALARAREVNPREEPTLARIAACLHLQKKDKEFADLVREVEKHNALPGIFYFELADCLEHRKLFVEAEKYYRRSVELLPKLPIAQNGLGMLYMRLGKEDEARKILEQGFEADRFNIRVSNTLRVLDHLDKYETLKTAHFHIRYDKANDKILANFLGKYLEDIYTELAEKFQYRPKGPILLEVFNKHEMFSGRVVALPDLHTIGACTGSVVAMVSPRDKSGVSTKPFNWLRVIRHEMVHVFNLEQTKFQVPHWFTEGLAVTLEGSTTPPSWHKLLAEKVRSNELMNLDNVLLGFIRPSSQAQWQQAYLQSQLYVEYLTKTHGDKAVAGMLDGFSAGLSTEAALEKTCNVKKADFEKGYREFLDQRVAKTSGAPERKLLTFKKLKEAHAKDPADADIAAQLAERYFDMGNRREAKKLAEEVLIAKGKHPLAAMVKAQLLRDSGDVDLALSMLETNVDAKTAEPKALRLLAKLQADVKKFSAAADTLELGRKAMPHDPSWLVDLAVLYKKAGENDKLLGILQEVVKLDPDDLGSRRKLAESFLKDGKHAQAETYARQALEIDVLDRTAQDVLLEALEAQNKNKELDIYRKLLEK